MLSDRFEASRVMFALFLPHPRKGGSDVTWISNARASRRASSKLSWYQCFGNEKLVVLIDAPDFTRQFDLI